jgi:hypothetical protein
MSVVRALRRDDLVDVANLLGYAFQNQVRPASPALAAYLGELFLDLPDRDPEIEALVHLDATNRITGFIGIFSQSMVHMGRTIRVAIASSFAVDKRSHDPLAAPLLLRAFLQGPQDLSLGDRANSTSVAMWRSLRGPTFPYYSFDWLCVLHPVGYAAARAARRNSMARLMTPLARSLDRMMARRASGGATPGRTVDRLKVEDVDDEALLDVIPELVAEAPLHPVWTPARLRRVLSDAAQKSQLGDVVRQVVRTRSGSLVGTYMYHVRSGDIATTVQVLARKGQAGPVLDCLLADATARGAVAVGGRAQPVLLEPLMERGASFTSPLRCLADARDKTLLAPLESGEAIVTGLVGEYWTRLNDDGLH